MWPGIWTVWQGKKIKIIDCAPCDSPEGKNVPGLVTNRGIIYCANNTALQIFTLQLEGKTEMKIADFLNGYQNFIGTSVC